MLFQRTNVEAWQPLWLFNLPASFVVATRRTRKLSAPSSLLRADKQIPKVKNLDLPFLHQHKCTSQTDPRA